MSAERVLSALLERLWTIYCGGWNTLGDTWNSCGRTVGAWLTTTSLFVHSIPALAHSRPASQPSSAYSCRSAIARRAATCFNDTHLTAQHYEHPAPLAPKIFISQLEVEELPADVASAICHAVGQCEGPLDRFTLGRLHRATASTKHRSPRWLITWWTSSTSLPWSLPGCPS